MIKKRERKVHHPHNLGFTLTFDEFPEEFAEFFDLPGKFKRHMSRKLHKDKKEHEMDAVYIATKKRKMR